MKRILSAASIGLALLAAPISAATIDLGFAIDESGSVSGSANSGELGLLREGLARALDLIPSTGATGNPNVYTVTVVRFSSSAGVLVDKTEITDASRSNIQDTLRTAGRFSGSTNIPAAVDALTAAVCGMSCTGDTTLFNIATDGQGGDPTFSANGNAISAGVDGISYEAIGGGLSPSAILDFAFPDPAVLVNDAADLPNPINTGFVFAVDSFDDFENAIAAKVGRIVTDTGGGGTPLSPVPLPAAGWMLIAGLGGLLGISRRKV